MAITDAGAPTTSAPAIPACASTKPASARRTGSPCPDSAAHIRPGAGRRGAPRAPRAPDASTFTIPEIARLLISVGEGRPLRDCAHEIRDEANRRHGAPNPGRARPRLERRVGGAPDLALAELPAGPIRPPRLASEPPPPRGTYNYSGRQAPEASGRQPFGLDRDGLRRSVRPGRPRPGRAPNDGRCTWPWARCRFHGVNPVPEAEARVLPAEPRAARSWSQPIARLPGHGYPFHARFGGGDDKDSWIDFFRSLTGAPTWIVAGARRRAIRGGRRLLAEHDPVRMRRPDARRLCAMPPGQTGSRRSAPTAALSTTRSARRFATSRTGRNSWMWQRRSSAPQASQLRRWLDDNEALVISQFFLKRQYRGAPTDDSPVRAAMDEISGKLLGRTGSVRNLWRLNLRLALMCAHWSDLDREREYAAVLDRHFAALADPTRARRTAARPDWASGRDFGGARSIADFLVACEARREAAEREREGQLSAPLPRPISRNAARVAVGLPPIPTVPTEGTECPAVVDASVLFDERRVANRIDRQGPSEARSILTARGWRSKGRQPAGRRAKRSAPVAEG